MLFGEDVFIENYSIISGYSGGVLSIGNNVRIHSFCKLATCGGNLSIGNNVQIGDCCTITAQGGVTIEENVLMADKINIIANQHVFNDIKKPIIAQSCIAKPILIKKGAWIRINATILSGVTVGENSVIGANAVVTKNIPDYTVAVGIPARIIRRYDFEIGEWISV